MGTDYFDLFQLHGFDAFTPIEEALGTLSDLVRSGKIRYIGCSNFAGWHLMKSLGISEKYGWPYYIQDGFAERNPFPTAWLKIRTAKRL